MEMKQRNRAASRTPAMPITRRSSNPEIRWASAVITSSGLLTMTMTAFGERFTHSVTTPPTIFAFVLSRSERDIPGFRAMPAVIRMTSESFVSS
jgi:hypothetical protein